MSVSNSNYKLFGDHRSGNCYKAAWILRHCGIEFEWIETDVMTRETRSGRFLALNPNGRVPLLVFPDGRRLAESNAILLHLGEGGALLPADAYERALVYQWLFFEQYSHEPYIAVARFIVHLAKSADQQRERMELLWNNGYQALAVMESQLQETNYFAGQAFSIADMALYAYTHTAADGGFDLDAYPFVLEWLKRVEQQPGFVSMSEACR